MRRCVTAAIAVGVVVGVVVGSAAVATAAPAETPDSRAAVTRTSPIDKPLAAVIGAPGDQDWFRFRMTKRAWARVTLTYQPANYRLDLYDRRGRLLRSSRRPHRQFEEIYRPLRPGAYFVRVRSQGGSFDRDHPYRLRFDVPRHGLTVLSTSWWRDATRGGVDIACDLVNNSSSWQIVVGAELWAYDRRGSELGHGEAAPVPDVLRPHGHSTCEGSLDVSAARVARVVVRIRRHARTGFRPDRMTIRHDPPLSAAGGGVDFTGSIRNDSARATANVDPFVVVWAPSGRIRDVPSATSAARKLRPGHSTTFTAHSDRARVTDLVTYRPLPSYHRTTH